MAYFKIGVFGILFLTGCGLVKKVKNKSAQQLAAKQEFNFTQKAQSETNTARQRFLLERDSAGIEFLVEIWPRGPFNFSPYKGFEGTAQKIIYFGKAAERSTTLLQEQLKSGHRDSSGIVASVKQEVKLEKKLENSKVERSVSWKWVLFFGVLLLVFGLYFNFK